MKYSEDRRMRPLLSEMRIIHSLFGSCTDLSLARTPSEFAISLLSHWQRICSYILQCTLIPGWAGFAAYAPRLESWGGGESETCGSPSLLIISCCCLSSVSLYWPL